MSSKHANDTGAAALLDLSFGFTYCEHRFGVHRSTWLVPLNPQMVSLRSGILVVACMLAMAGFSASGFAQSGDLGSLQIFAGAGGGRLQIDGEFVADLKPSDRFESPPLKPGRHNVRLEMPGYLPVEEELVLRPGAKRELKLDQQPVASRFPNPSDAAPREPAQGSTNPSTIAAVVLNNNDTYDFETQVKGMNGDVMWVNLGDRRHLIAQGAARIAMLGNTSCENLPLEVLKAQPYSLSSVSTGSGSDHLNTGTVIAVRTKGAKYACMRIAAIGPALTMTVMVFR